MRAGISQSPSKIPLNRPANPGPDRKEHLLSWGALRASLRPPPPRPTIPRPRTWGVLLGRGALRSPPRRTRRRKLPPTLRAGPPHLRRVLLTIPRWSPRRHRGPAGDQPEAAGVPQTLGPDRSGGESSAAEPIHLVPLIAGSARDATGQMDESPGGSTNNEDLSSVTTTQERESSQGAPAPEVPDPDDAGPGLEDQPPREESPPPNWGGSESSGSELGSEVDERGAETTRPPTQGRESRGSVGRLSRRTLEASRAPWDYFGKDWDELHREWGLPPLADYMRMPSSTVLYSRMRMLYKTRVEAKRAQAKLDKLQVHPHRTEHVGLSSLRVSLLPYAPQDPALQFSDMEGEVGTPRGGTADGDRRGRLKDMLVRSVEHAGPGTDFRAAPEAIGTILGHFRGIESVFTINFLEAFRRQLASPEGRPAPRFALAEWVDRPASVEALSVTRPAQGGGPGIRFTRLFLPDTHDTHDVAHHTTTDSLGRTIISPFANFGGAREYWENRGVIPGAVILGIRFSDDTGRIAEYVPAFGKHTVAGRDSNHVPYALSFRPLELILMSQEGPAAWTTEAKADPVLPGYAPPGGLGTTRGSLRGTTRPRRTG